MPTSLAKKLIHAAVAFIALLAAPAFAHNTGFHQIAGFAAGFAHPFSGLDHLLATVAIGLWATQNMRPAMWVLPLVFPLMLLAGAILGMTGGSFPVIETGIAASVLALGLLVAFVVRMPVWASAALVSAFALLHGHAHGTEIPPGVSIEAYGAGFLLATVMLLLAGLAFGAAGRNWLAARTARLGGAGIAVAGIYLLAAV